MNRYLDREWVIYHFPSQYLPVVNRAIQEQGDRRFIYQRPLRGSDARDAGRYFGYGFVSDPYPDARTPNHFFMDIIDPHPLEPVQLRDGRGNYYETGKPETPNFRGRSIRYVEPFTYFSILSAGQAYSATLEPPVLDVQSLGIYAPVAAPTDDFRVLESVPPGTGYVPRNNEPPNPQEAAALHERARDDHQTTLDLILRAVQGAGGTCLYNNNVDLFARVGERRFLIEAKSLTRPLAAVDRMRYGMGQLFDYSVRYRAELQSAQPVLAFGTAPPREASWIANILNENRVAFVARIEGAIRALNGLAESLPFTQ